MEQELSATAAQTKENLIEAFWKLYLNNRIEKIRVSEICRISGYNRSTFYAYFDDVYSVLEEIENRTATPESFHAILNTAAFTKNFDGREMLDILLELFEANSKYLPVLIGEHGDPEFRKKHLGKLIPVLLKFLQIPSDSMPPMLPYIIEYQSSAVVSVIGLWYERGKDISKEELIDLIMKITGHGVRDQFLSLMH